MSTALFCILGGVESYIVADVLDVSLGSDFTCAIITGGKVKCWGDGGNGALAIGSSRDISDQPEEVGIGIPFADLGTKRATQISSGTGHTCARLTNNQLICWGWNYYGQCGNEDSWPVGDSPSELGNNLQPVDLGSGRTVKQVACGGAHSCAVLDNNSLKCWGFASYGQLGSEGTTHFGSTSNTMGNLLPVVNLGSGRSAKMVANGNGHTCVILDNNQVKCFGRNAYGQLGLGDTVDRGKSSNTMGNHLPQVNLGSGLSAKKIVCGYYHSCAILNNNRVKCWGFNVDGQLGIGDRIHRGTLPEHMGNALPYVGLAPGETAVDISAGEYHTCVAVPGGKVKCFGYNNVGQLGLGHTRTIGDSLSEVGANLQPAQLGGGYLVTKVASYNDHNCVIFGGRRLKCWGEGAYGRLGYGSNTDYGRSPTGLGNDLPFVDVGPETNPPPTSTPTAAPVTSPPTAYPTGTPTSSPTIPTPNPTNAPTSGPTMGPTLSPTETPSATPTQGPTTSPTHIPTSSPTVAPTFKPTMSPINLSTSNGEMSPAEMGAIASGAIVACVGTMAAALFFYKRQIAVNAPADSKIDIALQQNNEITEDSV